ncbi:MAG: Flp family type IVb pilin [Symbiobacteriia bacterium]
MMMNLWQDENGQGMVEYGLIIALVAVVAIAGLTLLGPKLKDLFTNIDGQIKPTV